jgi:hypothetical protein
MNYSIKHKTHNLKINIEPTYVDWQTSQPIGTLMEIYRKEYVIKNDVKIYTHSYFDILINIFVYNGYSLINFCNDLNYSRLKSMISTERWDYYENLGGDYEDQFNYDMDNLQPYFENINSKNHIILQEFKDFITGFFQYVKEQYRKDYSNFKYVYNLLIDDMVFFKNTKIKSLEKYVFTIGGDSSKHYESRGKSSDFTASGYCNYGSKIFINSDHADKNKHGRVWEKRILKQTFYHEIAHALDYLYYDDIVLKGHVKRQHSSYNPEFLKCCKLSYRKFKCLIPKLTKNSVESLSYFCSPEINKIYINQTVSLDNRFNHQLTEQFSTIFSAPKRKTIKIFSPSFAIGNTYYNYSRVLEEIWSESFALIFNWIKNPFSEYDKFILTAGESNDRIFIKINYHALMYMLNNFDWIKLNIPLAVVLRKKVQIKKLLNYVNNMPLTLKGSNALKFKSTKYLKFNDMLKNR